jgi:uncharacterized membrane protein
MPGRGSDIIHESTRPISTNERRFGLPASIEDRLMPLAAAIKLFALLFFEGASLGMAVWGTSGDMLTNFVLENQVPAEERRIMLFALLGGGGLAVLFGFVFLARAKSKPAERLSRFAWQASPLLLSGFLPVLFHWQIWAARELTFGVLVCMMGCFFYVCLSRSLEAGLGQGAEAWLAARRALSRFAERANAFGPPLIVAAAAIFYTLYFSYYTILYHHSVLTMAYDLGLENNLLWNVVHGNGWMKSSPLSGPHGTHFGFHATLFAYVIGIFYFFHQVPETLLVFQAATIGAAAIPLYLFARSRIGRWAASLLAVLYVMYPPVHGSNLYDFHYLPLGVFFLWLTLWLIDAGRYRLGALAVILTLSVREDVSAALIIIGAYLIVAGRRPRAGLVVTLVALIYFLVMKMVVMPRFLEGGESFIHQWQGLIPPGGHGYSGVLMTVLGNPIFTLTSLLEPDKFLYLVQIGGPFCFFVWRRPIGFFMSLPGFFFTLLSTKYPPLVQISFQYTAHWTAFLFPAFVSCLEWVRKPKFPGDGLGWRRQRTWLAVVCFTTLLTSYQYGAILQQNTARGGFGKYKFGMTPADYQRYADLKAVIAKVPPLAKITSAEYVVPHVSSRPNSYTLRNGLYDAQYLIFEVPVRDDERPFVREALNGSFGVVMSRGPFVLAKKGHEKSENHAWLKRLR